MARYKAKFPIDEVQGTLGHIDRTIGREGGLSVNLQKRKHSGHLALKVAPTRGGSDARHERSRVYCECDADYKTLTANKRLYNNIYWRARGELDRWDLTNYQTWMKMCLSAMPEKSCFAEYSYLARYRVQNTTTETWIDKIIKLLDVSTKRSDWKDVQVFSLGGGYFILQELSHKVETVGQVLVKIPYLDTQCWFFADVYSYSDIAHQEGW